MTWITNHSTSKLFWTIWITSLLFRSPHCIFFLSLTFYFRQFSTGRLQPLRLQQEWSGLFETVQELLSLTHTSPGSSLKVPSQMNSSFVTLSSSSSRKNETDISVVVVSDNVTDVEPKSELWTERSGVARDRTTTAAARAPTTTTTTTTAPRKRKRRRRKKMKKSQNFPSLWLFAESRASEWTWRCRS